MNNLELLIIKGLMIDGQYSKYRKYLDDFFNDRKNVYSKFLKYLDYKHEQGIQSSNESVSFFACYPNLKRDEQELYGDLFKRLEEISDDASFDTLLSAFKKKQIAYDIAEEAVLIAEGNGSTEKLLALTAEITHDWKPEEDVSEFVSDNLEELLSGQGNSTGLNWRLRCLREGLGPLRVGDFGFIFARPETGKTTFLASEVTYFLDQIDREHPVIWFNNEEQGSKVKLRCIQSAFGIDMQQLTNNRDRYKAEWLENYDAKLLIRDSATITRREVESIVKDRNPSLIVFDQIDKIKGFSDDRNDLELGKIYIWARELAKTYAPVIGVCQAGGNAENTMWLTMDHVVNAKTSKQAEADWILGIGALHDRGNLRYLHLSKNKLTGGPECIPESRHGKFQVLIQPMIARYEDI